MPKFNSIRNAFLSGEISDRLTGRVDLQNYDQACETLENFITMQEGGVRRRMGTRLLSKLTSNITTNYLMIPYALSDSEAYNLVISYDGSTGSVFLVDQDGTQTSVTSTQNSLFTGRINGSGLPTKVSYAQSNDILFLAFDNPNRPLHILRRDIFGDFHIEVWIHQLIAPAIGSPTRTFDPVVQVPFRPENDFNNVSIKLSAVAAGGRTVDAAETTNTAQEVNVFKRGMAYQGTSGDECYGAYLKSSKTGTDEGYGWILGVGSSGANGLDDDKTLIDSTADIDTANEEIAFIAHGSVDGTEIKVELVSGSLPTGLTDGGTYFINTSGATVAADRFRVYTTFAAAIAGAGAIDMTAAVGTFNIYVLASSRCLLTVISAFPAGYTSYLDHWQISAWNDDFGHPTTLAMYQERLIASGVPNSPDTAYGSRIGNLFWFLGERHLPAAAADTTFSAIEIQFTGTKQEDDPWQYIVGSSKFDKIKWLSGGDKLFAGTLNGVYIFEAPSDSVFGATTPPKIRKINYRGATGIIPEQAGSSVIFASRDGKELHDLFFDGQIRGYNTNNLSVLNRDILYQGFDEDTDSLADIDIKKITWSESEKILWILTSSGELLSLTFNKELNVTSWSRHSLGKSGTLEIISIQAIQNQDNSGDELMAIVRRGSSTYLEKIGGDFEHTKLSNASSESDDYPWFLDFASRFTGASSTAWALGSDYASEEVSVLADGFYRGEFTADGSGNITLNEAATEVIAGFKYTSKLKTTRVEAGSAIGSAQGQIKRIDRATINFYRTWGASFGRDSDNNNVIDFRTAGLGHLDPLSLFTGNKRLVFPGNYDTDGQVYVETSLPFPCNIISITMRGTSNE